MTLGVTPALIDHLMEGKLGFVFNFFAKRLYPVNHVPDRTGIALPNGN
jgi:hypothetical protein